MKTDFQTLGRIVHRRLSKNMLIRQDIPGGGRLRIDRQLPFLCVCRPRGVADAGTRDLVTSEAAYLHATANPDLDSDVVQLCWQIASVLREHFGTFLFIEVWADETEDSHDDASMVRPQFVIQSPGSSDLASTAETFSRSLADISIDAQAASVSVQQCEPVGPPALPPLTPAGTDGLPAGCVMLGLVVKPIYRDRDTGETYPMVLQQLRRQLALAIRKTVAAFTGADSESRFRKSHHHSLGPTSFTKEAGLIDHQLCEMSESFDFLIQTTPVNVEQAWTDFQASGFTMPPAFRYPPLPFHVSLAKRRLFSIEIEQVEDSTLARLFYEKQAEMDIELTALSQLDTPEFLQSNLQLYGGVDDDLSNLAVEILTRDPEPVETNADATTVGLDAVVSAAREEFDYYHRQLPEFNATVEICDELASGLMVSQHRLLLARTLQLSERRLDPLLHHEVGTHLLTYFNGRSQLLRQLYTGLAGYEELQEGLAVLGEYLTGGLTVNRLRTLAGRVIAGQMVANEAGFATTFQRLRDEHQFSPRESFTTTLRAYRGGGSTKDIVYLRGLRDLLDYLSQGHDVEPLYVGKLALHHVPLIQELRRRGMVKAPSLLPRFWKLPGIQKRLQECRTRCMSELLGEQK